MVVCVEDCGLLLVVVVFEDECDGVEGDEVDEEGEFVG